MSGGTARGTGLKPATKIANLLNRRRQCSEERHGRNEAGYKGG
jgi:hypothetical protein